jgi:membrane protease YdiL (CAAX protease family)
MRMISTVESNVVLPIVNIRILTIGAYTLLLFGAEATLAFVGLVPGTIFHAILVAGLLVLSPSAAPSKVQESGSLSASDWIGQLAPIIMLVSLLRLASVVIPIRSIPEIYWYAMIGAPILAGVGLTARLAGLSMAQLGLTRSFGVSQLAISSTGLPLGLIGYSILRPQPAIDQFSWAEFAVAALIIVVFTGFLEEVLFRGVLQSIACRVLGKAALLWGSTIFAIMFLGSLSLPFVLFMGLVALLFAWCCWRTTNLWGVIVAHCLMNLGFLLVYPLVF